MARILCLLISLIFVSARLVRADESPVDFAREIYPLLQRACLECHGAKLQRGGLRLDQPEAFQAGGDSGPVVKPGAPDQSELVRRIALPKTDPDVMPNRGAVLTADEIARVRRWIQQGAEWPAGFQAAPHWAYLAPRRPRLLHADQHPIDELVVRNLPADWPHLAEDADAETLARRLHLDLIGLPPTPAEVDSFRSAARDNLAAAIEQRAIELMARPQYGERWARPWLDAARYADSHGFQRDDLRDLWPYRDWVIRALNADLPFDQFTIEQLAGDLLPNATEAQRVATGFQRCAPCNVEAGTDPEENRVNQVMDRVNTLGTVWLGTTLECCQCHDHKYDPFTLRDYYRLFAVFNQTEIEADRSNSKVPGSIRFLGPYLTLHDAERTDRRAELTDRIAALRDELMKLTRSAAADDEQSAAMATVLVPEEFKSQEGADHRVLADGSVLLTGDPPATDVYEFTVRSTLSQITGFRLEALTDDSLPGKGPGRGDAVRSNFVLHEFTVTSQTGDEPGRDVPLTEAVADFSQQNWDVAGAIDGNAKTGWAIAPQFHRPHWARFRVAKTPLTGPATLTFRLVQKFGSARTLGRVRISAFTGPYPSARATTSEPVARLQRAIDELQAEMAALVEPRSLVMQAVAKPRVTHVLERGDFRTPGEVVQPGPPAHLPPRTAEDGPFDRLALARWLMQPDQPLVARVTVNRLWSELFGEGLVATPEDFGAKGDRPYHAELLDWLAVEFREQGWSQKRLLLRIVTSRVYRQSAVAPKALGERDPQNRWLARGARYRLPAETLRDNALAIAGLLNTRSFGAPIRPPQPAGLWDKVGGEKYDYVVSPGDEQYRRGIYVVLKRMSPYPSFISFDATARLACRVKRVRSNTPLQALVLLNDPVYTGAARSLAERIRRGTAGAALPEQIQWGFRLATSRHPTPEETGILVRLFDEEQREVDADSAWFVVACALLNLDETLSRN